MSEFCPHCEGEMDDFGGVHLRSCPLAQGNEQAPSEHREKAVEAAAVSIHANFRREVNTAPWQFRADEAIKAAEPHLQRMYWERFGEAVLSPESVAEMKAVRNGPLLFQSFGEEGGRRLMQAELEAALDKAQDLMEESK